jgi:hypothetical protein
VESCGQPCLLGCLTFSPNLRLLLLLLLLADRVMDAAGKVDMMVLCAAVAGKPYTLSPQVGSRFTALDVQNIMLISATDKNLSKSSSTCYFLLAKWTLWCCAQKWLASLTHCRLRWVTFQNRTKRVLLCGCMLQTGRLHCSSLK